MNTFSMNWEDEDCNRIVELLVEYEIEGERAAILDVTPMSVSFREETGAIARRILVWTETGRRMLREQFQSRVGTEQLLSKIPAAVATA